MMDLDALERAAQSATPGPWTATEWRDRDADGQENACGWNVCDNNGHLLPMCSATGDLDEANANASLIAASNPQTVIALVRIARAAVAWRDVPKERLCIAGSDLYAYCDFLDALREAGL